jgi:ABC-type transport system involved in multi-copper enzyme maturation permease subunit
VLTPAYLAGAVAGERERRTLDVLFTTELTNGDIVLGKLAARAAHLGGVLLAGLPLLALIQLWGGVDGRLLAAAFLVMGLDLLTVGAVSVLVSAHARTVSGALLASYAASIVIALVYTRCAWTPAGMFDALAQWQGASPSTAGGAATPAGPRAGFLYPLALCAAVTGVVTVYCVAAAILTLRPVRAAPGREDNSESGPRKLPGAEGGADWWPSDDAGGPGEGRAHPPPGDWPLLWKETYRSRLEVATREAERRFLKGWPQVLAVVFALSAPALAVRYLATDRDTLDFYALLGRLAVALLAGLWCLVPGFGAAAAVSRERERRTLDGLLTLPVSRATVLGAKWLGPVLCGRASGYGLATVIVAEVAGGGLHPLGALLLAVAVAAHVAFLAGLGVWASVLCPTTGRARLAVALVLLFLVTGGPAWLVAASPERLLPPEWKEPAADVAANAPGAWWFLTFSPDDFAQELAGGGTVFTARLVAAACGAVTYALLAALLWLDALRNFRAERSS